MTTNDIPEDYAWPGGEAIASTEDPIFWISPDPKRSATPLFLVCGVDHELSGGISIIAEKCYLRWAMRIVDGLRLLGPYARNTGVEVEKLDKPAD